MITNRWTYLLVAALLWGCDRETGPNASVAPSFSRDGDVESEEGGCALPCGLRWSDPVNLGAVINTASNEMAPSLSSDELSLYFSSNKPGGRGGNDIYVAKRTSVTSPWQAPENLGPVVNTAGNDAGASFSSDGLVMFFASSRSAGQVTRDAYVSHRADAADDFGWGEPVSLGPLVNTAFDEGGGQYIERGAKDEGTLYFGRSAVLMNAQYDLFTVRVTRAGVPLAAAQPIVELNIPAPIHDAGAEVTSGERQMIFQSSRDGTLGSIDLWVTVRQSIREPWATPPESRCAHKHRVCGATTDVVTQRPNHDFLVYSAWHRRLRLMDVTFGRPGDTKGRRSVSLTSS